MNERSRGLQQFPNYKVFSSGCVFSSTSNRFLKGSLAGRGYLTIQMRFNGLRKREYIHRLVALLFLKRSENCTEVNHKNGIKTDNRAANLEWVTRRQNLQHSANILGNNRNESNGMCKFSDELVRAIRHEYNNYEITQASLSRKYGISKMQISRIVRNKLRRL